MNHNFVFFVRVQVEKRRNDGVLVCILRLKESTINSMQHYATDLYTRYHIVAHAWPLGRVHARAKVSCIQATCVQDTFARARTRPKG